MEMKITTAIVFAIVAKIAVGIASPNPYTLRSEIRIDYSVMQGLERIGKLGYLEACVTVFTDVLKFLNQSAHGYQNTSYCLDDTAYEYSKEKVAAGVITTLDVTFDAMRRNDLRALRAIGDAQTKTYPQASVFAKLFYDAIITTCANETPEARQRLRDSEKTAVAGVKDFAAAVFAPALKEEKIAGDRATVQILTRKAASELVRGIHRYFAATRILWAAMTNGTEAARKSAYVKIEAIGREVCQHLQTNMEIRFAGLKARAVANSIIRASISTSNLRKTKPQTYENVLDDLIDEIDNYLSAVKVGEHRGSNCDFCLS